jgi:2'-5' RNA ligase
VSPLRRAFLAVVPPPAALEWTDAAARVVGDDGFRLMPTEQRHLTVQFLGAVADADALARHVGVAVRPLAPFVLGLGGGGAFPSARRATVVWLGVREGDAALGRLATAVREASVRAGVEVEERPFRAHLTLARVNRSCDVRAAVAALDAAHDMPPASPRWTVDDVVLFESEPVHDGGRTAGVRHVARARFRLAG